MTTRRSGGAGCHVVFVCSGNICRSPMAAVVFRSRLAAEGLADEVRVSSAGVGPWHVGQPMDRRASAELSGAGYPVGHRAAQVDEDHLDADLLLAMDDGHYRALCSAVDDPSRVRMFRSFDPEADGDLDVPDPYYGGPEGFADLLACVERCMPGLLSWVRSR